MRKAFAHDALVILAAEGDLGAPGAAVTAALCGHWDHQPPCPLAPHHTAAQRAGAEVRLRVLFACEPPVEDEVRGRIVGALRAGRLEGPDGVTTAWRLAEAHAAAVREDEAAHADRLIGS